MSTPTPPRCLKFLVRSALVGLSAAVWLAGGCGAEPGTVPSAGPNPAPSTATNIPSAGGAASAPAAEGARYRKLLGRWQRTDADYVIEVRSVEDASGRVEAAYLNPNPIHVGQALASEEGGKIKLFVELQDVGYPGSNYRLTYFPATDQLYGVYYQATAEQSFDIEFERVR